MKRLVAIAALSTSLAMVASASATVEVESFDNPFTLDTIYGAWGAPFTTFTSNPTDWEVQSMHYGSGYKYLGAPIDGTGNNTLQLNVTVNAGVAGVLIDLNDSKNNGESFKFYGLVPGGGTNGGNNYVLTAPLAPDLVNGTNYFDGTGILNISDITQMNVEIDPGPSTAPYDVHFNDVSLINLSAGPLTSTWNSSTGGSWNNSANWLSAIPNGAGTTAILGPALSASAAVSLDAAQTVGHLVFNNSAASYTVSAGTNGTLTIDNSGTGATGSPEITVISGTHAITAPLTLANGVTSNTSSGTTLVVSGIITGLGPLTVLGPGTLKLAAANTFSGGTIVSGGILELTSTASLLSSSSLNISSGTVTFDAGSSGILKRSIGSLSIGNATMGSAALVSIASATNLANRTLLVAGGLSIAGIPNAYSGKLDVTNNDLDVQGATVGTLNQYVAAGYHASGGSWTGNGITSSTAAADPRHLTALGVIQNNQSGTALYTATNTFDGATPSAGDILVKFTYYGDANLDGKVDGTDYSRIDSGYLMHLTGWFNGDFNYDATVDGSDYTLIDNAFNIQGAQQTSVAAPTALIVNPVTSAVPEPTAVGAIGSLGLGLLRRRRR